MGFVEKKRSLQRERVKFRYMFYENKIRLLVSPSARGTHVMSLRCADQSFLDDFSRKGNKNVGVTLKFQG